MDNVFKKSSDDIKKEIFPLLNEIIPEKNLYIFLNRVAFDIYKINQSLDSFINQKWNFTHINDDGWNLVYEINSLINFTTNNDTISIIYQSISDLNSFTYNLTKERHKKFNLEKYFFNAFEVKEYNKAIPLINNKNVGNIINKYLHNNLMYIKNNFEQDLFYSFEIIYAMRNIIQKFFDADYTFKHDSQFEKHKEYTPYKIYNVLNDKLELYHMINDIDFSEELCFLKETIDKYGKQKKILDIKL